MVGLRPAFVVTAILSTACSNETTRNPPVPDVSQRTSGSGAPASASATVAAPPTASPTATASSVPTATVTLRKRAGKRSKPGEPKQAKPGSYVSLHPTDKDGRRIDLANDDSCYVVVPKKTPPPKDLSTGERWTENVPVDCPPELDDPAWDGLPLGDFLGWDEKTGACAFVPDLGNPPPPPRSASCPKVLPKKK
jgi:hypothetical protein